MPNNSARGAMRHGAILAALAVTGLGLSGCAHNDRKSGPKTPIFGERTSILGGTEVGKADETLAKTPVLLPDPVENADWPQSGGSASKAIGGVALGAGTKLVWQAAISGGSPREAGFPARHCRRQALCYRHRGRDPRLRCEDRQAHLGKERPGGRRHRPYRIWRRRRCRRRSSLCLDRHRRRAGAVGYRRQDSLERPSRRSATGFADHFTRQRLCDEPGQPAFRAQRVRTAR